MKKNLLRSLALMAMVMGGNGVANANVDETVYTVIGTVDADIYVYTQNGMDGDNGADNTQMEVRSDWTENGGVKTYNNDFVGLMKFSIPAEATASGATITEVSLKLVTKRIQSYNMDDHVINVYGYTAAWDTSSKYQSQKDAIAAAREGEWVAQFTAAGVANWDISSDAHEFDADKREISVWTNEIILTPYVTGLTDKSSFSIMLSANKSATGGKQFFTINNTGFSKTYDNGTTDTSDDFTVSATADELKPVLTVKYKTVTGINTIETDATPAKKQGTYTLQGVRVDNPKQPGVYVVNGKKVVKK